MRTISGTVSVLAAVGLISCTSARNRNAPAAGALMTREAVASAARDTIAASYGAEDFTKHEPYSIILSNGMWIVTGTLRQGILVRARRGGVPTVVIRDADGEIVSVSHSK